MTWQAPQAVGKVPDSLYTELSTEVVSNFISCVTGFWRSRLSFEHGQGAPGLAEELLAAEL